MSPTRASKYLCLLRATIDENGAGYGKNCNRANGSRIGYFCPTIKLRHATNEYRKHNRRGRVASSALFGLRRRNRGVRTSMGKMRRAVRGNISAADGLEVARQILLRRDQAEREILATTRCCRPSRPRIERSRHRSRNAGTHGAIFEAEQPSAPAASRVTRPVPNSPPNQNNQ